MQYLKTLRGGDGTVLGKYNHVYFVLFFLVLFYLELTADYTNIVASCVALPNSICEHVDTNNMNIYDAVYL